MRPLTFRLLAAGPRGELVLPHRTRRESVHSAGLTSSPLQRPMYKCRSVRQFAHPFRMADGETRPGNYWKQDRILPATIQHPCAHPGCPRLLSNGARCPEHRAQVRRAHDDARGTSAQRGYDAAHRRLRVLCFERDGWRCVDCGWEPEIVTWCREFELGVPPTEEVLKELRRAFADGERHLHADHQEPIDQRPDLRLEIDNLRTRCNRCHQAKTMRECARGDR
jgi:5-methylcytosine-specific restriction enzyme A